MKILAIETTGSHLSVCLWEGFRVCASLVDKEPLSNRLILAVDGLFKKVRWSPRDLDAVAVDVGPGRSTGMRFGVSAARTLGQTLQKPVVEVTSLEALAAQGSGWEPGKTFVWKFPQDLLCVLTEALREDIYMAVWRSHKLTDKGRHKVKLGRSYHTFAHHFKLVHASTLYPFERFLSFFESCFQAQTFLFVGSAVERYRKDLQKVFGSRARFAPDVLEPQAHWVAALSSEKFFRREIKPYNRVKPLYLRPSYAEENARRAKT
jgi:tRNA threonylcarbamoyladenosine biosynthesis protein TsaB